MVNAVGDGLNYLAGYDELEPILQRFTARNHRVLILGCGTSTLGEELAVRGFSRVEAVDYSENAILRMRETQETRLATHARQPPVRPPPHPLKVDYRIMDVTKMTYPDRSVDCVLDKATLDTMKQLDDDDEDDMEFSAPGASDKAVKPDPRSHAQRMLRESCRVLKPGGHYVCITYGEPQTRLPLFDPNNEGLGEWENAAGGDEEDARGRGTRARDAGDGIVRPGHSGVFVRGENGEGFGVRKKCVGAR